MMRCCITPKKSVGAREFAVDTTDQARLDEGLGEVLGTTDGEAPVTRRPGRSAGAASSPR